MIINHNLAAMNAFGKLTKNNKAASNVIKKLSSGLRINGANDDAAGLVITEKMRAQVRGLKQAERNIQDGISLLNVAEGGLASIQEPPLQRLRELAIEACNDTLTDADRNAIQNEASQIKQEIDTIANNTQFNGIQLLNIAQPTPAATGWIKQSIGPVDNNKPDFASVIWAKNKYVAVDSKGNIYHCVDGASWSVYSSEETNITSNMDSIDWNGSIYTAVGNHGTIMTSEDGIHWDNVELKVTSNHLSSIVSSEDLSVAVGMFGTILTKQSNGEWTNQVPDGQDSNLPDLYDVAWNGEQYIAVGEEGTIMTSCNGTDWTEQSSGTEQTLYSIAYCKDQFIAVGFNGTILTSQNGINWSEQSLTQKATRLFSVTYGSGQTVIVGLEGTILTSVDGHNWVDESYESNGLLKDIVWNGTEFIAIGTGGDILKKSMHPENDKKKVNLLNLQAGANSNDSFEIELSDARTEALGIGNIDLSTRQGAETAILQINKALEIISAERGKFGAYVNRLDCALSNTMNYEYNLTASQSRIEDADMAREIMAVTRLNILSQVSQSMLTHANQQPQQVVQLLR